MVRYNLLKGEAGTDFVTKHQEVRGVVLQEMLTVLKKNACFILGDLITDKLNGLERELGQAFIDEMREFLGVVFADQEHMPD